MPHDAQLDLVAVAVPDAKADEVVRPGRRETANGHNTAVNRPVWTARFRAIGTGPREAQPGRARTSAEQSRPRRPRRSSGGWLSASSSRSSAGPFKRPSIWALHNLRSGSSPAARICRRVSSVRCASLVRPDSPDRRRKCGRSRAGCSAGERSPASCGRGSEREVPPGSPFPTRYRRCSWPRRGSDLGIVEQGARDGDALPLTPGEAGAPLAQPGVVSQRRAEDEIVCQGGRAAVIASPALASGLP